MNVIGENKTRFKKRAVHSQSGGRTGKDTGISPNPYEKNIWRLPVSCAGDWMQAMI